MKKKLLFVVPWHPYPLHCGGALRAFHLARQFGRHFDTHALFLEDANTSPDLVTQALGDTGVSLTVENINVPIRPRGLREKLRERWITFLESSKLTESANSVSLALLGAVQKAISKSPPDIVVLTEIECLLCARAVRRLCPDATIVVDMHNVNHKLHEQFLLQDCIRPEKNRRYLSLLHNETHLHRIADHVFACSQSDLDTFLKLNDGRIQGSVVPNGVDTRASAFDDSADKCHSKKLIFCASLTTQANLDGLTWFHQEIWPIVRSQNPGVVLTVVGSGQDNPQLTAVVADPSVIMAGRVSELGPWYRDAGVAICPLRLGSGTRLKILEAMSFGNPVVSTSLGCEGLAVQNGKNIVIKDSPEEFSAGISRLLHDPKLFADIRMRARDYVVGNYDWDVIGDAMAEALMPSATDIRQVADTV
jgi:glycosyltransferase involved in cell wall biosynthesis